MSELNNPLLTPEQKSQVLTDLANSPTTGIYGIDVGQDTLSEGRPPKAIQGEDGQYYLNNEYLDENGVWQTDPDFSTPVYFFHQPLEVGDAREIYAEYSEDLSSATKQGNWFTEAQIKEYWEGEFDTGTINMDVFREQHPDMTFDQYMSFIGENTLLYGEGYTPQDNPEMFSEITDKYGIQTSFQGDTGHVWGWNGSNYEKTYHADKSADVGGMIMGAAVGAMTGGLLSGPVTSALGTGALGKGVTAGLSSAISQGVTTGSVDPRSVITSGLMAGLAPGAKLAEGAGLVPDSFGFGVVQGATDSALSGLLSGEGLDLQGAALAGLGKGAMNSILDFFDDMSNRSVEDQMALIEHDRERLGLPPLSDEELYSLASQMPGTGTSDLGGLIGKDGLIPGIDEVDTSWLNGLLGGGEFRGGGVFIGPDGKRYTDTEILEMGMNPSEIGQASLLGQNVDGFTYAATQTELTALGKLWEGMKEHVPGVGAVANFIDNGLDAAARQQFINEYGFDPLEHPEAAKDVFIYGKVDETYTFSDNPRGQSEVIGRVPGLEDEYSTGPDFNQQYFELPNGDMVPVFKIIKYVQDASNSGLSGSSLMSALTDTFGESVGDVVLPGYNQTITDVILQGLLDGANAGDDNNGGEVPPEIVDPPEVIDDPEDPVLPPEIVDPKDPVLPPEIVDPPPVLPPGGEGGPPELPGRGLMSGGDYTPQWGQLFAYTTLTPYQKEAVAPYVDYIEKARGMMS